MKAFDPEKAVHTWRRFLSQHHSISTEDADELESHLRDDIDELIADGLNAEVAFKQAMQRIGDYATLESAYRDVLWKKRLSEHGLLEELRIQGAMLKNYFTIALRNLRKQFGYTLINITGMAVGLACCLLILIFVRDELSYDQFHEKADRIFRVTHEMQFGDQGTHMAMSAGAVASLMKAEFPEVEQSARLIFQGRVNPVVVRQGDRMFQETGFFYADSTLFDVFTFPFLSGDPATALVRPHSLVMTETMVRKYFGDADPLGQTVQIGPDEVYEVTGVIEDLPAQSHVHFDLLGSISGTWWAREDNWNVFPYTYVVLRDPTDAVTLEPKLQALVARERGEDLEESGMKLTLHLQPLTDIHLRSALDDELSGNGSMVHIYAFSAIALLILLIACINYMNLATARSTKRAREVGIRKVVGAYRDQLIRQFFGESVLQVGLAVVLAVLLAELCLPLFNNLSGKQLDLAYLDDPILLVSLIGLAVLVSFLAGSYPALLLSSVGPVKVLKGTFKAGTGSVWVRKGLVVFQFAVTVFLLIGTAVVYRQIDFFQQQNLGFDKEQIIAMPMADARMRDGYSALKSEFLGQASIQNVSAVSELPGYVEEGMSLSAEGMPEGQTMVMRGVAVDHDLIETLGLELVAGRNVPDQYMPDEEVAYVLNETAVQLLGWTPEEALGKWVDQVGRGRVVGVVHDFHFNSLKRDIDGLAFFVRPQGYRYMLVKVAPEDVTGTMDFLEATWNRLAPHRPFDYQFLDAAFDALYRSEQRIGRIFALFTGLAIFIACLGLFGLASFAAEQRTKEIGIRKVLGASVSRIVFSLSKEFIYLVGLAFIVAAPVAYLVMTRWLEGFAFHVDMVWWIFVGAGLATLCITWITIGYQSVKAALINPVRSLRYE